MVNQKPQFTLDSWLCHTAHDPDQDTWSEPGCLHVHWHLLLLKNHHSRSYAPGKLKSFMPLIISRAASNRLPNPQRLQQTRCVHLQTLEHEAGWLFILCLPLDDHTVALCTCLCSRQENKMEESNLALARKKKLSQNCACVSLLGNTSPRYS